MKVTAFIRQKDVAKTDMISRASIYFRVRDEKTRTDIKAASELTINPNHWSSERQGYKGRISQIPDEVRLQLNRQVMEITEQISREFYIGATSAWLQKIIFEYHHPNAFKLGDGKLAETGVDSWIVKYIEAKKFNVHQASNFRGLRDKIHRFECYQQQIKNHSKYKFAIGTVEASDLTAFQSYMEREHEYLETYPTLFALLPKRTLATIRAARGGNTVNSIMTMLRTVIRWAIDNGAPNANPFDKYTMPSNLYGTPYYLTIEERDRIYNHDFSNDTVLEQYRDMFIFQCMVGCRHGDLVSFTADNIIDGVLEYIPTKTRNKIGKTVRVPLSAKALAIVSKLNREQGEPLFPLHFNFKYNDAIRAILTQAGVTRIVTVIDTKTRTEVKRPINEIASSHMARRTFVGNLYKQVKDPNLVASMSGHAPGSRAFARYRTIDDEMKVELIGLID
jgi:integrase